MIRIGGDKPDAILISISVVLSPSADMAKVTLNQ